MTFTYSDKNTLFSSSTVAILFLLSRRSLVSLYVPVDCGELLKRLSSKYSSGQLR